MPNPFATIPIMIALTLGLALLTLNEMDKSNPDHRQPETVEYYNDY